MQPVSSDPAVGRSGTNSTDYHRVIPGVVEFYARAGAPGEPEVVRAETINERINAEKSSNSLECITSLLGICGIVTMGKQTGLVLTGSLSRSFRLSRFGALMLRAMLAPRGLSPG